MTGTTVVVVDVVVVMAAATMGIDVATPDVAAVQAGRFPLPQLQWWVWLVHRTSLEYRLGRRGLVGGALIL